MSTMLRFTRVAPAAALAALLSACASVPLAPPEQDAAAKEFRTPPPDRAHVYLFRNESFGAAIRQDVIVDGLLVGQTAAKVFFLIPVTPGAHTITSKSENTFDLPITTQGGRSYFVWQEVKMGVLKARTKLHLVEEATGMAGVNECKLALPTALPPVPEAPGATVPRS